MSAHRREQDITLREQRVVQKSQIDGDAEPANGFLGFSSLREDPRRGPRHRPVALQPAMQRGNHRLHRLVENAERTIAIVDGEDGRCLEEGIG